jgi:hypothetical protein
MWLLDSHDICSEFTPDLQSIRGRLSAFQNFEDCVHGRNFFGRV